jgi:hypothetical protein
VLTRQRVVRVAIATTMFVFSAGAVWAANGANPTPWTSDVTSSTDVTTTTTADSTTTAVIDTTTTEPVTTTTVDETTTTVDETTTVPETPTTSPASPQCKPGWGYGDTNHCHSGPPGLSKHDNGRRH